jgi:hypothetical protein
MSESGLTLVKNITFRGNLYSCYPRLLWQALFDLYCANGCAMENMDNMLIDYDTIKREVFPETGKVTREFIWGCTPTCWYTEWFARRHWCCDSPRLTARLASSGVVYVVKVDAEGSGVKIYKIEPEDLADDGSA